MRPAILALALVPVVAFAQDESDGVQLGRLQKKAETALEREDWKGALEVYGELLAKLEKSKLPESVAKPTAMKAHYNSACCYALTGKKREAIRSLEKAIASGFSDWTHLELDTDLDSIREDPSFKEIVAKGKAAAAKAEREGPETASDEARKALREKPLFDFSFDLTTIDGKRVRLADLKGKVVVIDFFGSWAPPSRLETKHLVKLSETYKEKGLAVVGIAWERKEPAEAADELVREFVKAQKIGYPVARVERKHAVFDQVPIEHFPTRVFVDRAGKVRLYKSGGLDYAILEALVKPLLEADEHAGEEPF